MHGLVREGVSMRTRVSLVGVVAWGVLGLCGVASAETIDEVGKKIAAASGKLNSFSAKMKMVTEMKQEGFSMVTTSEGTTEMLRKGDLFLTRSENKGVVETNMGGNVSKQESSTLSIVDGSFSYAVSEMAGMKSAQKMKMQKPGDDPLSIWRQNADLKLLPDASVDGHAVWAIEATPKNDQMGQGKSLLYFQKDSGQMIKMVVHTPDGKPMTTMTFTDIKLNEKISPDRFVFTPPPGVEVQDLSQ
jgi:outer membrane lipoprotein-sorting protein